MRCVKSYNDFIRYICIRYYKIHKMIVCFISIEAKPFNFIKGREEESQKYFYFNIREGILQSPSEYPSLTSNAITNDYRDTVGRLTFHTVNGIRMLMTCICLDLNNDQGIFTNTRSSEKIKGSVQSVTGFLTSFLLLPVISPWTWWKR